MPVADHYRKQVLSDGFAGTILVGTDSQKAEELRLFLCAEGYDLVEAVSSFEIVNQLNRIWRDTATRDTLALVVLAQTSITWMTLTMVEYIRTKDSALPVIAVGNFMENERAAARELGAVLVERPYDSQSLMITILESIPQNKAPGRIDPLLPEASGTRSV